MAMALSHPRLRSRILSLLLLPQFSTGAAEREAVFKQPARDISPTTQWRNASPASSLGNLLLSPEWKNTQIEESSHDVGFVTSFFGQSVGFRIDGMEGRRQIMISPPNRFRSSEGPQMPELHGIRGAHTIPNEARKYILSREWLVHRVLISRERRKAKKIRSIRSSKSRASSTKAYASHSAGEYTDEPQSLAVPPPSQPLEGPLEPSSSKELKVAPIVVRSDLVITRNIEWGNLLLGFEQENRYVIMDPRQSSLVGYIVEQSHWLFRQFLRTRRSFTAYIMDVKQTVQFTVRRPFWLINSTIYVEIDGKVVGQANRRWHLWKRVYDLYLGQNQFAVVENPGFWNWTFTLQDENGGVLAEIDRYFRGFGYEFLTDAGQYAIRFGDVAPEYQTGSSLPIVEAEFSPHSRSQGANATVESEAENFTVVRPLTLLERTVTLALAVSLDNDYFSRHGGWLPFPIPFFGGGDGE